MLLTWMYYMASWLPGSLGQLPSGLGMPLSLCSLCFQIQPGAWFASQLQRFKAGTHLGEFSSLLPERPHKGSGKPSTPGENAHCIQKEPDVSSWVGGGTLVLRVWSGRVDEAGSGQAMSSQLSG